MHQKCIPVVEVLIRTRPAMGAGLLRLRVQKQLQMVGAMKAPPRVNLHLPGPPRPQRSTGLRACIR
jgi:hypothetical protein